MREIFSVARDAECRVWHCCMISTYELLDTPSQTLQDTGLHSGKVSFGGKNLITNEIIAIIV